MTPFEEGVQAARERRPVHDCPYTFDKCPRGTFSRAKLDDWFNGWKMQLERDGLGFNMNPIGQRYKKAPR